MLQHGIDPPQDEEGKHDGPVLMWREMAAELVGDLPHERHIVTPSLRDRTGSLIAP